jgi:hypothetical protein
MKMLQLSTLALILAGTAALSFAGPGPQYWQARANAAKKTAAAPTAAQAEKAPCTCRAACHA